MTFERLIIIRNPVSTDAHRAARRIRDLQKLCPTSEIIILDTKRGGRPPNLTLLQAYADKLGEQTLLCIAGGDGTVNMFLDILLRDNALPDAARKTPVLPLWGGNANDLAYMLNGPPTRWTFRSLFTKGRIIAVRPLVCTMQHDNETTTHFAACYASFGASGFAMQELERMIRSRSPMRQPSVTRFGHELVEVFRLMFRAPTFTVSQGGKKQVIFERIFLNGSRFAKVAATQLRLTEPRFHRNTAERKNLFTVFMRIFDSMRDLRGRRLTATHDQFTIHDTVWAQFDGEVVAIPAETIVTMEIAKQPFYALSTRLR